MFQEAVGLDCSLRSGSSACPPNIKLSLLVSSALVFEKKMFHKMYQHHQMQKGNKVSAAWFLEGWTVDLRALVLSDLSVSESDQHQVFLFSAALLLVWLLSGVFVQQDPAEGRQTGWRVDPSELELSLCLSLPRLLLLTYIIIIIIRLSLSYSSFSFRANRKLCR